MPRNIINYGGNGKISLIARPDMTDPDAINYVNSVQTADNQSLERETRLAIDAFVKGCKNDNIWDAIKNCCILSGARTLNGALIPLKGVAPTNNNFVSADYNRATGLKGNGTNKSLNTNIVDSINNIGDRHLTAYLTEGPISSSTGTMIGTSATASTYSAKLYFWGSVNGAAARIYESVGNGYATIGQVGFFGGSRPTTGRVEYLLGNSTTLQVINRSSLNNTPSPFNMCIFAAGGINSTIIEYSNPRISFYSLGSNLDLVKYKARVVDLMTYYSTLT